MFYGLDVHKSFIQVCRVDPRGRERYDFTIGADHDAVAAFAQSLSEDDAVVLEATFHSWAIWSLLQGHGARVVVANSLQVKAIAHARIKTWELRQLVTHRQLLARHRTATRNAICGLVNAKLLKAPMKELFGPTGRRWLLAQHYTPVEKFMLDNSLAHLDAINERLKSVNAALLDIASVEQEAKLLMTIPGVNVTVAIGLLSAIGDITRFASPDKLAAYFGLVPRVYQSADTCHHGPITKQGRSQGRWLAVEAAQSMVISGAPLTATYHRVRHKKSHNVAIVALARKLVVVVWHLLTHHEPYRYAQTKRTRAKLRRVTPGIRPAKIGCVPNTLEELYTEVGLPEPRPPSVAEKRCAANNRRTITRHRKAHAKEKASA